MVLRKFYVGQWYQMAVKYKGGGLPGTTIRVSARYTCTATPLRAWQALADGYSIVQGVMYAGTQSRYNNLNCG